MMKDKFRSLLFLHFNIMVFSFTGIFSKLMAESIKASGLFAFRTILWGILILLNCGIYALFWQQSLKRFPVNVAYAYSSVYNIWSLLWAVLIFSEKITVGNIVGTLLMISGIVLIRM